MESVNEMIVLRISFFACSQHAHAAVLKERELLTTLDENLDLLDEV